MTAQHNLGYARVSTTQQSLEQQHDALRNAGVERIFEDKMSGAKADRPGLAAMLDHARRGDTVTVVALDRLGRSTIQVLSTLRELQGQGVIVRSLRENLDFSTPVGQAVATIMSALAEMELSLIRERAAAARDAARARGRQVGRPRALTSEQAALARRMRESGEPIPVIAGALNTSRATIYRAISAGAEA
jgi:DNA invertase Pin-like site-specific DNA recombinase